MFKRDQQVRIINKNLMRYGRIGTIVALPPEHYMVKFDGEVNEHTFWPQEMEPVDPPPPEPELPPVMGLAEVCQYLNLTSRRISMLKRNPRFPEPIAILRLGSIWDTTAIQKFAEIPRRPGPKKKT